jgi:hypothetical protein
VGVGVGVGVGVLVYVLYVSIRISMSISVSSVYHLEVVHEQVDPLAGPGHQLRLDGGHVDAQPAHVHGGRELVDRLAHALGGGHRV